MAVQIQHHRDLGEFDYGAADQLSPLVRRVICKNPNPFTYKGTGTYIVGRGEVAVIDAGPPLDSHVDDIMAALEPDETVTHILVTHTHSDHSPASGPLSERTGAPTYGFGPHGEVRAVDPDDKVDFSAYISEEERKQYEKELEELPDELKREGADSDFVPAHKLNDGDVLEGGTWTLVAHHTPGHCSNHLCFELPQEKTLFSGDHVMGWATSVVGPPDGSMKDYLDSLRKLLPLDVDQYLPTHGPAIANPGDYVSSFIEHREDREQQIVGYLEKGPSKIADFIPEMYAAYDKRLWYPAAGSVHAHLLHMIETGRVVVTDGHDPKLTATYGLA
ncbi:MAG: MBL fold metallo-hydrolase [Actinomycetia bacterium]|nr:MBL fold metallo-hydrolase [Actinomycetes bacterium]